MIKVALILFSITFTHSLDFQIYIPIWKRTLHVNYLKDRLKVNEEQNKVMSRYCALPLTNEPHVTKVCEEWWESENLPKSFFLMKYDCLTFIFNVEKLDKALICYTTEERYKLFNECFYMEGIRHLIKLQMISESKLESYKKALVECVQNSTAIDEVEKGPGLDLDINKSN